MPNRVHFGFLNHFFSLGADVDVSVHVEPADPQRQIRQINQTYSSLEAQIRLDEKADRKENITVNMRRMAELDELRAALQTGNEKMYYLTLLVTVSAESESALDKACATLEREGIGRGFQLMDAADEQGEGLLSVAPIGVNKIRYPMVVFGSFLANMFPFTSSQFSHKKGVLVGFDRVSGAPMYYNAWKGGALINANGVVIGQSGSGKSYFLKTLISHSILHGIQTVIVDWEGEYVNVAKALDGTVISIKHDAKDRINPCELEEEEYRDERTGETKVKVDLLDKIEEMTDFTKYAASLTGANELTGAEIGLINRLWERVYRDVFHFSEDPASLYETRPTIEHKKLQLKRRRAQPQFGDFYKLLLEEVEDNPEYKPLADRLERVCAGRTLGLFDCKSTVKLEDKPIIVFDLSGLSEDSDLRKLGMYVALEWIVEKFIKKDPSRKKQVIVDEAQEMLRSRGVNGGQNYGAMFLDRMFTRIRKRGGAAIAASQQFRVFAANEYGQSIIRNSATKCLLRQDPLDEDALKQVFGLDKHELDQLYNFDPGEVRWDVGGEIVYSYYSATPFENKMWTTKFVRSEEGA